METITPQGASTVQQLEEALREQGIEGRLVAMHLVQKVVDSPSKYFLLDSSGRKRGFALSASPIAPDLIARSARHAREAKRVLGAELGQAVLEPICQGEINGLSYVLLPYCRPVRENKLIRAIQRIPLRPAVLNWLRQVCRATMSPALQSELPEWEAALGRIGEESGYEAESARALTELREGRWRPRYVLAHNDLWMNNLLYAPRGSRFRFVLIDWAGSSTRAYPAYDLVRFAISSGMSRAMLSRELEAHAAILEGDRAQMGFYLLSALGHLGLNLDQFPLERYRETAEVCWRTFQAAE